jgi:peroxiredoxin Q/BCP
VVFFIQKQAPGCTAEACNLDNYDRFKAQGYEILGVSADVQTTSKL